MEEKEEAIRQAHVSNLSYLLLKAIGWDKEGWSD